MQDIEAKKEKVRKGIENLINNNALEQAKKVIKEYEEVVPDDVDIYSFKGIIAILEGNIDDAERILKNGSEIYEKNFDIMYNLGYLYELTNNNELSIKYYKNSLINANNENEEISAYNALINLGIRGSKEDIINNYIAERYYEQAIEFDSIGNKSDAALYYGLTYRYSKDNLLKSKLFNMFSNKVLKDIFYVAANSTKKRFIILSSCGWSDIYQRMHHISRALVKLGNEVIYITPSAEANVNNEVVDLDTMTEFSMKNSKIIDGVKIYPPITSIYNDKAIANNYTYLVQKLLLSNSDAKKTIIVTYMPYQVDVIRSLQGNFMHIYDCVDDHSDLDYAFWGNKKDVVWEQELMDSADAITTTATSLYLQRVAIEKRNNVYLSRNAVNEGDFISKNEDIPEDLKNIPEPRIVYSGAIYDWFDKKLFYDVVKSNPDKSFVIIGFGNDKILSEKCSNLYILGAKKHSELKTYLKYCQVGIIPFKDDTDLIINCDPIKQYEYIACGLPVVTTYMPEAAIGKINTLIANTKENFNKAIEESLNFKIDKNIAINFLLENSWNARAALLCNIADERNNASQFQVHELKKTLETLTSNKHPNFLILYAIMLNIENVPGFLKEAEVAYNILKTNFIERWYIYALYLNEKDKELTNIILSSKHIDEKYKIELLYCIKNEINNKEIIIMYCIKNYFNLTKFYNEGKLTDASDLGNYFYESGKFEEAINIYDKLIETESINLSPLALCNYSQLLKMRNEFYTYKHYHKRYVEVKEDCLGIRGENKCKNTEKITVLIPTKNRLQLLDRCITHFECINDEALNIQIFILDASDRLEREKIKEMLITHNSSIISFFEFDPHSDGYQRIASVIDKIEGEYCCLCADDDFLDKDGIIESIKILKNNKDVITVKGESYIFINNDLEKVYYFKRDSCRNLEEDNPVDRMKTLVDNWVPQFMWLVYRKSSLMRILKDIQKFDKELTTLFKEYLWYFLVPLYGKVANIKVPLNIRDENPKSGSYTFPGFFHFIKDGSFNKYYKTLKEAVSNPFLYDKKLHNEIILNFDYIIASFLANSWGIPRKFINIKDGIFDINLLNKAIKDFI